MKKSRARRLQAFQRQNIAYEKLLRRYIRQFIKEEGANLARLALNSDWDNFHNICLEFKDKARRVLTYIYQDTGEQAFGKVR